MSVLSDYTVAELLQKAQKAYPDIQNDVNYN